MAYAVVWPDTQLEAAIVGRELNHAQRREGWHTPH